MLNIQLQSREVRGTVPGPHLLITGGVHGDEFEPMAAVRRLMSEIDPAELSGRVTLVPVVNEPAFLRGQRTAEDGLDLARTCPGDPEGSITERIADALSELIRSADFYIDLHTGGTGISLLPLVGYTLHPKAEVLDVQRRMARAFGLPVIWGTQAGLDGRSLSVARDADVPAIYAEYEGAATCNPAGVRAYVDGCLGVLAELGMLEWPAKPSVAEHFVEDNRAGAGHLQVCNPSPLTGFFEQAVTLGAPITKGDIIGTVCDVLGETIESIVAAQSGIVLGLTTFSRVHEGDSVAVILEIDDS
jgi:predicted deacylase